MILFFLFVIVPLMEIGLFLMVGGAIGIANTLLLCVLSAIIGSFLVRAQGLAVVFSARAALARGKMPVSEMFDGLCLGVAGALLMLPGFFTDALGFSLLIPPVRRWLRQYVRERFNLEVQGGETRSGRESYGAPDRNVIDVEYETIEPDDKP